MPFSFCLFSFISLLRISKAVLLEFNMHTHHLGILLKTDAGLEDLGWGLRVSISDMLQVMTMFLVHR